MDCSNVKTARTYGYATARTLHFVQNGFLAPHPSIHPIQRVNFSVLNCSMRGQPQPKCCNLYQTRTECKSVATFGNCWQMLGTFGNIWQPMATFGNFWHLLAIFGNSWLLLAPFGYSWQQVATLINFCLLFATFGYFWQQVANFDNFW